MRYALIVLALTLTGCAESRFEQEQPITAQLSPSMPKPCGPDDCGKKPDWETR